jgi:hypothetical protein
MDYAVSDLAVGFRGVSHLEALLLRVGENKERRDESVSALPVLVYGVSFQRGWGGDKVYGARRGSLHRSSGLLVAASVERRRGAGRVWKTRSSVGCQLLLFRK